MTGPQNRDDLTAAPLGAVVRKLRTEQRLTLDALAKKSNVSKRTIQEIEKGGKVRCSTLELVAAALSVPLETILFDIVAVTDSLIGDLYVKHVPGGLQLHKNDFDSAVEFWISGDPRIIPFAGVFRGHDGVAEFFDKLFGVIAPRRNDPPPSVSNLVVDHANGGVVVDLENDLVRLRRNPSRTLTCKVKCTFRYRERKLVYFENLFDTSAWEVFLSDDKSGDFVGPNPVARSA